jgi:TorA maturation chaperone TorD
VVDRLEAEDLARARWYSFFSRWFLAAPDQQALDLFDLPQAASAPDVGAIATSARAAGRASPDSWLQSAWQAFAAAAATRSLAEMRAAYDDTFISVGEAPVSLHASVYLTGFSNERPLAEIRQWLSAQGIQSSQEGLLTEDHLGLLCEAMAWLIIGMDAEGGSGAAGAAPGVDPLTAGDAAQQHLFDRFIAPVCDEFCQRLSETPGAGVYRELGQLFAAFCAVERQAFEIER